jgi:ArsR family transcriptional regulator
MALAAAAMLDVLRAIGEDTRLRIVAMLRHGELTVTDLTDILGQSQPASPGTSSCSPKPGVVDRHREGM